MTQKTAVEWLIDQLKGRYDIDIGKLMVCNAAKEIEREQIIEAFDIACEDENRIGKEYYYDTYGGQGSPDTPPNTQNK